MQKLIAVLFQHIAVLFQHRYTFILGMTPNYSVHKTADQIRTIYIGL